MPNTFQNILEELREAARSKRDLGDRFERLIAKYLLTDPLYKDQFSDVWLWSDWPDRENKPDTGIDIVAKLHDSTECCAIQCKFYDPEHTLQKGDIDSFFTTSGKEPFTSRMIISTTDKWSKHAEEALENQKIPVKRLRLQDLADSPIDWSQFSLSRPQEIKLKEKKRLRPHQIKAHTDILEGFKAHDRGKMIMACGTGKTFTALKIAETLASNKGNVLFLVPSISLLSQTLREWTAEAEVSLHCFAVCSDPTVGRKSENEDISVHDLAFPATTNVDELTRQIKFSHSKKGMTVIFSTYQSIEVISKAQSKGLAEFELIVCDEAHRTTGVTAENEEDSRFVRVHDQDFIKGKKRLYMTATPRIYSDVAQTQAKENDLTICSMDDEEIYGPELHRLGFSEAVGNDLLSDYKVMVLAVDEKYISKTFQNQIADSNNEISLDDAVKIVGCWNGLAKRMAKTPDGQPINDDLQPMRRAVAFSRSIKDSKRFMELFSEIVDEYSETYHNEKNLLTCEVDHVDGTFPALKRNERLDWLKADTSNQGTLCRILSNARCLSEGVDVPALDAVMFLNPRNSVVDVVQSVGRVMRKAEGKKYGYVILPIGIPADIAPEEALKDNKKYRVVWQVLQALRAHDDRFNATVNQLELNRFRPDQIQVIGVGGYDKEGDSLTGDSKSRGTKEKDQRSETQKESKSKNIQLELNFPELEEWRNAIYAKIVIKCGDRQYWETWAKDVAQIAERHITRIKALVEDANPEHRKAFNEFLNGLKSNINPSIDDDDAIEMLSQHLITKPVFDALFEGYQFTQHNPVSLSMQKMLDVMERQALEKETTSLEKFYASVKERATGIDNAIGKQKIVLELYDKFFRTAFPLMADRLGIVYTPVEVVDFIIKSADDALRQEFGVGLTDEGVHVLDPFVGTGTFIVRLLQSGLIKPEDLERKYTKELHANEIILLAYYIAAINVEATFHDMAGKDYQPFEGIVLTDTFQTTEGEGTLDKIWSPENNQRVIQQKEKDIRVIIGNPPYSAGQTSENDANKNLKYETLDGRIRNTYAEYSTAVLKNSLYDSYIRAIRWASDRIKDKGIICYVTNASFMDSNSADGLRKCLTDEFTSIYCFNLRGNGRTSGETCRKEGHPLFAASGGRGGSLTPIAITLLIKNPIKKGKCQLFYHDIGDYLKRPEKLKIINDFGSIKSIPWNQLTPNEKHDWINQRNESFEKFVSLGDKKDKTEKVLFAIYSSGIATSRDAWTYNFSKDDLALNMQRMISFYKEQVKNYHAIPLDQRPKVEDFIDNDERKISWTRGLKNGLSKYILQDYIREVISVSMYRPYSKQWLYFDKYYSDMVSQIPKIFPNHESKNYIITVCGIGASKDFSALITDSIPNRHLHDTGQCFPLYYYEKMEKKAGELPGMESESGYIKRDAVTDTGLADFRKNYKDTTISKEDIFYYIYGILHSPEYKQRFEADLKKMLPRIPFAKDFWAFSKAGRELANWHLNYETIEPYPLEETANKLGTDPKENYRVEKMIFGKHGKEVDKSTIHYNSRVTLSNIPLEAYNYIVNGKSALDWIMERYKVTIDKDSQIRNDPNDWSEDPRYIIDLVKRIVRVSLETVKIVKGLPELGIEK